MTTYKLATRGRYVEAEVNRNLVFRGASNENSRIIRVTVMNIDIKAHRYTVVAATSSENWEQGQTIYTHAVVDLEAGDIEEVVLDIGKASTTPPNSSASYNANAINVFVDNATKPDVVVWPIWVLNTASDQVAHVIYDKTTKYTVFGDAKRTGQGITFYSSFFIADIGSEDYLPVSAASGIMIAISPLDRMAGIVDVTSITSQGAGDYLIKLNPVTTGYLKIATDIVVDYNKFGSFLGSAMAWITSFGADAVAVFLRNRFVQHMFLATIDPFLAHHLGIQHLTMDAYVDPQDSTKVHIVLKTFINVNDDPPLHLAAIIAIAIAFAVGAVAISWAVTNVSRADVQKTQMETMRDANRQFHDIITDPNLSEQTKQLAAKHYGTVAATISQLSGAPACDGLTVGNTCIPWWIFMFMAMMAMMTMMRR